MRAILSGVCRKLLLSLSAVVLLAATSCNSYKNNLTYFSDLPSDSGSMTVEIPAIRIVPDDVLMITVTSLYPEASAAYNLPLVNPAQRGNAGASYSPQQQTYLVDSKGDIDFPVLGRLKVEGMTTEELSDYLTRRIEEKVIDPIVHVELINFHIQVIGEVNRPGSITVNKERFSILDALAASGDLTPYGLRDNVLLVRQENGKNTYHRLNLNDSKTLSSPLYYLKQNDVIIVEPNDIRKANSKYNQDNAYKLSVVSTIVSAASVVASLAIALAVK